MKKKIIKYFILRYSVKDPYINGRIRKVIIPARTFQDAIKTLSIAFSGFYNEFTVVSDFYNEFTVVC